MRKQEEIERQINALEKTRNRLPEFSFFGDENHKKIDAQIAILKGDKDPDDYWMDETAPEYEDGDNDEYWAAVEADEWMDGVTNEDLTDEEDYN